MYEVRCLFAEGQREIKERLTGVLMALSTAEIKSMRRFCTDGATLTCRNEAPVEKFTRKKKNRIIVIIGVTDQSSFFSIRPILYYNATKVRLSVDFRQNRLRNENANTALAGALQSR